MHTYTHKITHVHTATHMHTKSKGGTFFAQYQMVTLYVLSELCLFISSEERVLFHLFSGWREGLRSLFSERWLYFLGDKVGLCAICLVFLSGISLKTQVGCLLDAHGFLPCLFLSVPLSSIPHPPALHLADPCGVTPLLDT